MPVMAKDTQFMPGRYTVYVEIAAYPNCGFKTTEKYISRLGPAASMAGVEKLIADDRKAMGETYGGLIEPTRLKGRTYKIFESTWQEVTRG